MAKTEEKNVITFDSESTLQSRLQSLYGKISEIMPNDSKYAYIKRRFQSVYGFFNDIFSKNQKLLERINEVQANLISNASKIATIMKVVQEDSGQLSKVKQEYEDMTMELRRISESEKASRHHLNLLRTSLATLEQQVSKGEAFGFGGAQSIGILLGDIANLTNETQLANDKLKQFEKELNNSRENIEKLKKATKNMESEKLEVLENMGFQDSKIEGVLTQKAESMEVIRKANIEINNFKVEEEKLQTHLNDLDSLKIKRAKEKDELWSRKEKGTTAVKNQHRNIKNLQKHIRDFNESNVAMKKLLKDLNSDLVVSQEETKKLEKQMKSLVKENEELTSEMSAADAKMDTNEEKKEKQQKAIVDNEKKMREKLSEIQKQEESQQSLGRKIQNNKEEMSKQSKELLHLKDETLNSEITTRNLNSQKVVVKRLEGRVKAQQMALEAEISEKMQDTTSVNQFQQQKREQALVIEGQNKEGIQIVNDIALKIKHQAERTEESRKEYNKYKTKYELLQNDFEKVRLATQDVLKIIEELKVQERVVANKSSSSHFIRLQLQVECLELAKQVEYSKELLFNSERTNASIVSEVALMNHILADAKSDQLQISKETQGTDISKNVLTKSINDRTEKMNKLEAEIFSILGTLDNWKQTFASLQEEKRKVDAEFSKMSAKNEELLAKRKRFKELEAEERRLIYQLNVERERSSAIVTEMGKPRNVHKWTMLETVNPGYYRDLMYLNGIYSRIDKVHRRNIRLKEKESQLRNELKRATQFSAPPSQEEETNFKSAIEEKTMQIKQYEEAIKRNLGSITLKSQKSFSQKESLWSRKTATFKLKSQAFQMKEELVPFFVAEQLPGPQYYGGGFNVSSGYSVDFDDASSVHSASSVPYRQSNRIVKPRVPSLKVIL